MATNEKLARENDLVEGVARLFPPLELECEGKRAVLIGGHEDDIDSINVRTDGHQVVLLSEWVLEHCLGLDSETSRLSKKEERRLTLTKALVSAYGHQHVPKTPLLQWCQTICSNNGVHKLPKGTKLMVFWWDMEHSQQEEKMDMKGKSWWPAVYAPKHPNYGVWFAARVERYDAKQATLHISYDYNEPEEREQGKVILPLTFIHFGPQPPLPGTKAQVLPPPWKPPSPAPRPRLPSGKVAKGMAGTDDLPKPDVHRAASPAVGRTLLGDWAKSSTSTQPSTQVLEHVEPLIQAAQKPVLKNGKTGMPLPGKAESTAAPVEGSPHMQAGTQGKKRKASLSSQQATPYESNPEGLYVQRSSKQAKIATQPALDIPIQHISTSTSGQQHAPTQSSQQEIRGGMQEQQQSCNERQAGNEVVFQSTIENKREQQGHHQQEPSLGKHSVLPGVPTEEARPLAAAPRAAKCAHIHPVVSGTAAPATAAARVAVGLSVSPPAVGAALAGETAGTSPPAENAVAVSIYSAEVWPSEAQGAGLDATTDQIAVAPPPAPYEAVMVPLRVVQKTQAAVVSMSPARRSAAAIQAGRFGTAVQAQTAAAASAVAEERGLKPGVEGSFTVTAAAGASATAARAPPTAPKVTAAGVSTEAAGAHSTARPPSTLLIPPAAAVEPQLGPAGTEAAIDASAAAARSAPMASATTEVGASEAAVAATSLAPAASKAAVPSGTSGAPSAAPAAGVSTAGAPLIAPSAPAVPVTAVSNGAPLEAIAAAGEGVSAAAPPSAPAAAGLGEPVAAAEALNTGTAVADLPVTSGVQVKGPAVAGAEGAMAPTAIAPSNRSRLVATTTVAEVPPPGASAGPSNRAQPRSAAELAIGPSTRVRWPGLELLSTGQIAELLRLPAAFPRDSPRCDDYVRAMQAKDTAAAAAAPPPPEAVLAAALTVPTEAAEPQPPAAELLPPPSAPGLEGRPKAAVEAAARMPAESAVGRVLEAIAPAAAVAVSTMPAEGAEAAGLAAKRPGGGGQKRQASLGAQQAARTLVEISGAEHAREEAQEDDDALFGFMDCGGYVTVSPDPDRLAAYELLGKSV